MKVIGLTGGPGCGKSTCAAALFAKMKIANYKVELVTEYAKDLSFENRHIALMNQVYLLGKQYHRVERLRNQVDWVVTDSPIFLGCMYAPPNYPKSYEQLVIDLWNQNENHVILLNRTKEYQTYGRKETEDEAKKIDVRLKNFLDDKSIPYDVIDGNPDASDKIFDLLHLHERIL
jgi:nicotinamide riboside kinase